MTDNSISILTLLLFVMIGIMFCLVLALFFVYFKMKLQKSKQSDENIELNGDKVNNKITSKRFVINSIFDFMEFDKIEDNMIIQKNGARYVMVVECQGINYDLMSQAEKVGVEEGFVQFLNTLNHPVQIYTQTRKINLENSIQTYRQQVDKVEIQMEKQQLRYKQIMQSPNATDEQRNKALYEYTKAKNLYDYGKDIIFNTEKMSLNKNILNKKYYVVIPYYSEDIGQSAMDKEEISERAFSELYTRAQAIIATLAVSGVAGKVMSSVELADLLYVAYNRDEADTFGIDRAIRAGYNEMYSTGQDYMDKKMQILDAEIERKAAALADSKVLEVQSEKQREYREKVETKEDIISNLAKLIIEENEAMLGKEVAEKAKEKIGKEKNSNVKEKEGKSVNA